MFIKRRTKFFNQVFIFNNNFHGLPKVYNSKIIQEAIQVQNSEYIEIYEPLDLTLQQVLSGPNCPTRRLTLS